MESLFDAATTRNSLRRAWHTIRANGMRSPLLETRDAIGDFERNAEQNISRIQYRLRAGKFNFDPQKGVLKQKSSGKKRGIVMAPVHNRIVERAWLNCLQERIPFVRDVIQTATSVGGVPDRSVPHGLALIRDAMNGEGKYFVRADISGFFDGIPRQRVLRQLTEIVDDERFLKTLDAATEVTLANEKALGEDRSYFPIDYEGVAQGSPLSALFGNILLNDFDRQLNGKGIVCVRFIDDFIILGKREAHVAKAFEAARKFLADLKLECHDPYDPKTSPDKAQHGPINRGFVFLGYDIRPGLFQPSTKARQNYLGAIDGHLNRGRHAISDILQGQGGVTRQQRYVQTLAMLDHVIRGWGNAYAYSNAPDTLQRLDLQTEEKIERFRSWYRRKLQDKDWQTKRRAGGVCLLDDIERKSLDELPFRLLRGSKFRETKDMIVVSTDGSAFSRSKRASRENGPGGWGIVFHKDKLEANGSVLNTTNNEMELLAVIEALKRTPSGSRVRVETDSRYVYGVAQEAAMVRSHTALWNDFQKLRMERRVTIVWVRGHSGNEQNERADALAREAANKASETPGKGVLTS